MQRLIILFALVLLGCATEQPPPSEFQISHFRQGVIHMDGDRNPSIVALGNDFAYQENGTCMYKREWYPCMWHGFEFDFEAPENLTILRCETNFDRPTSLGNWEKHVGDNITVFKWEIKLRGRRGHYIHPQYDGKPDPQGPELKRNSTVCFLAIKEYLILTLRSGVAHLNKFSRAAIQKPLVVDMSEFDKTKVEA